MPRAKRKRASSTDQDTAAATKKSKVDDLTKLTVAKLKVQLKKYGLDQKGRKADLVARLQKHLDEKDQAPAAADDVPVEPAAQAGAASEADNTEQLQVPVPEQAPATKKDVNKSKSKKTIAEEKKMPAKVKAKVKAKTKAKAKSTSSSASSITPANAATAVASSSDTTSSTTQDTVAASGNRTIDTSVMQRTIGRLLGNNTSHSNSKKSDKKIHEDVVMVDVDEGFEDVMSSSSSSSSSSLSTAAPEVTPEENYDARNLQLVSYKEAARVDKNGVLRTSTLLASPNILLSGHTTGVTKLHFTHDGTLLISSSMGKGHTFVWDLTTEDAVPCTVDVWAGHEKAVLDLAQTSDSACMLTASADATVGMWALDTGKMVRRLRGHRTYVNSVATCVPSGERGGASTSTTSHVVGTVDDDGRCLLWDLRSKNHVGSLQHEWPLTSCCFGMNGSSMLFAGGLDNILYQYDLRKGINLSESTKNIFRKYVKHKDTITGMSLSPCGSYIVTNGMDNRLIQWDIRPFVSNDEDRMIREFIGHQHNFEKLMLRCSWSADSSALTCGSSDAMVNIWNANDGERMYALPGHRGTVTDVMFHPTEPIIASCGIDGQIYLGELEM